MSISTQDNTVFVHSIQFNNSVNVAKLVSLSSLFQFKFCSHLTLSVQLKGQFTQ